jgi:hypothetical protein
MALPFGRLKVRFPRLRFATLGTNGIRKAKQEKTVRAERSRVSGEVEALARNN